MHGSESPRPPRKREGNPWDRVLLGLEVAVVLLGLVLRARGFLFQVRPLWLDECAWAVFLFDGRFGDENLRPIGFMALSRALSTWFGASESVLRALPWIGGVATVLMAPSLARRLAFAAPARLFFVASLALHPAAIDFAKEFKPYGLSLGLHVAAVLLTLRYLASHRVRDLAYFLALAVVGTVFAQDLVFVYPAVFLLLGFDTIGRKEHVAWVLVGACLVLASLGAQYAFIWSRIPESESGYWGAKYNVFHTPGEQGYFAWVQDRYREMLEFPGYRRRTWRSGLFAETTLDGLRTTDAIVWIILFVGGLVRMVYRRAMRRVLVAVSPLIVLGIFNALDIWPIGPFRTNLFALAYVAMVAASAFDWTPPRKLSPLAPVPALLLIVLPLIAFERSWHRTKRGLAHDGYFPRTLARILQVRKREGSPRPEPLLLSSRVCPQWEYYTKIHPSGPRLRAAADKWFVAWCLDDEALGPTIVAAARRTPRVWTMLQGDALTTAVIEEAKDRGLVVDQRVMGGSLKRAPAGSAGPPTIVSFRAGVSRLKTR
jgi:hypothetical protein